MPLEHPTKGSPLDPPVVGKRVLAMSSWVASGHVGLGAIVPALQALGHDVVALPTVLLSCHPGHARFAGERVAPDLLGRMLDVLLDGDGAQSFDAVLTGYLPSAEHVEVAQLMLERIQAANRVPYLCDPVVGDHPKGLYIDVAAAEAIRDRLVPRADIVTPNLFELSWLAGHGSGPLATRVEDVRDQARGLGPPAVLVTSVPVEGEPPRIANLLQLSADACVIAPVAAQWRDGGAALLATVSRHQNVPHGTGDLLSALLVGHLLNGLDFSDALGRTVAGLEVVIGASLGNADLRLVASSALWQAPAPVAVDLLQ